jgi:tripartite-type tricarboxylate transporter receptor subunit TctC
VVTVAAAAFFAPDPAVAQGAAATRTGAAQEYPAKPVRIVDAFPPGGGSDFVGRLVAQRLTQAWGQQVLVDNRPGAAGTIGAEHAARSAPDGYTVMIITPSYAVSASIYKTSFDPVNDVVALAQTATGPFVVVVHPSVPVTGIRDLLVLARSKPGALNFASTGTGGITHLATELFKMTARVDMAHIPYKGTTPAVQDLIGGQIHLMFAATATAMPQVRAAKLRALAVTGPKRMAALPDLPTVAESGVPGYEVTLWYGMWGPRGLPAELVTLWNTEINRILRLPEIRERFASVGLEPQGGTPDEFARLLRSEVDRWAKVVKAAGVKAE